MATTVHAAVEPITVKPDSDRLESGYTIALPSGKCMITARGVLTYSSQGKPGGTLKLYEYEDDYFTINRLFYFLYQDDLFLLYDLDNMEYGSASMARIRLVRSRPVMVWTLDLLGFGAFASRVDNGSIYVSALSFIGRIDLNKGCYVWQKKGELYKYELERVYKIEVDTKHVCYYSHTGSFEHEKSMYLKVAKDTGAIVASGKV